MEKTHKPRSDELNPFFYQDLMTVCFAVCQVAGAEVELVLHSQIFSNQVHEVADRVQVFICGCM
jgi:hypothetical protein